MVVWIGVDDTDSLQGMCTTFLATELVRELTQENDLIGYPRLVRLNPNVPWKTRGNGAICVRVGRGAGAEKVIGRIGNRDVVAFPRDRGLGNPNGLEEIVARVVERWSRFDDETTNPAFAVLRKPPPPWLYWKAVRSIVHKEAALRSVQGLGVVRMYKNGRGVIGAVAATSWRPRDRTYEVLAYRDPSRWGTVRGIDSASVIEMDRGFPSTFNNFDYENRRVVIAPRSPCPVLFGIRGDDPDVLLDARDAICGEPPERSLVFETNQGTDDHVIAGRRFEPHTTVRAGGVVTTPPRVLPGSHVVFRMDGMDVTAYEPAKQFRRVVRALRAGDRVEVIAAVRSSPRTLNLEKLRILSLSASLRKVANPMCEACGKRSKSRGQEAPFRCAGCGARFPRSDAIMEPELRSLAEGWYEPPVGSRRHLSKPLKRFSESNLRGRLRGAASSDPYTRGPLHLDPKPRNPVPSLQHADRPR